MAHEAELRALFGSRWRRLLVGDTHSGKSFRLKTLAAEAQAGGFRVVVLEPAHEWMPFADLYDGVGYELASRATRIRGRWGGDHSWRALLGNARPLVLSFEGIASVPHNHLPDLCEILAADAFAHYFVIDGAEPMRAWLPTVAALLESSRHCAVAASAWMAEGANWLRDLCPDLVTEHCIAREGRVGHADVR